MTRSFACFVATAVCSTTLAACSPSDPGTGFHFTDGGADGARPRACSAGASGVVCMGTLETHCNADGSIGEQRDCAPAGQVCATGLGCRACEPGRGSCDGETPQVCRADGSGYDAGPACDASTGNHCDAASGQCANLCAAAATSNSYIGCEYWPVTTINPVDEEFAFAVAVANPQSIPADVTVERDGSTVVSVSVSAGGLETIELPWVRELKGGQGPSGSALVRGGAYRLSSSVPVTVYQFNALEYRVDHDCPGEAAMMLPPNDGQCFSYSNDASLLLPTHVLTGNYIVGSYAAQAIAAEDFFGGLQMGEPSQGFFAVVGADTGPVNVTIRFRAYVQASTDGSISSFRPGDTGMFTLDRGDVLQIVTGTPTSCPGRETDMLDPLTIVHYCDLGRDYDLTGTEIQATGKVAVVGGHACAFVPYNRWACDHLEETIFPLESWGKDVVVAATQALRGEPNVVRVISGHDGNEVSFEPAVAAAMTLNRGDYFELEARDDVRVVGSEALLAVQFLVGQDYSGIGASGMGAAGDPSMSLAIPTEQFRTQYTFLAPLTYEMSFVDVIAPDGQSVSLDGTPVSGFRAVGSTGVSAARVMVSGGVHSIQSGVPVGLSVYGFGNYTSYMYPGGLDFRMINTPF